MSKTVELTDEAYAMVCGLVARTADDDYPEGVNQQGIFGPIEEVQAAFPVKEFWVAVQADRLEYDEEAGF